MFRWVGSHPSSKLVLHRRFDERPHIRVVERSAVVVAFRAGLVAPLQRGLLAAIRWDKLHEASVVNPREFPERGDHEVDGWDVRVVASRERGSGDGLLGIDALHEFPISHQASTDTWRQNAVFCNPEFLEPIVPDFLDGSVHDLGDFSDDSGCFLEFLGCDWVDVGESFSSGHEGRNHLDIGVLEVSGFAKEKANRRMRESFCSF